MCIGGKSNVCTHHFIIMLHVCVAVGHTYNVYFLQMRTLFHITNYILHCQFSNTIHVDLHNTCISRIAVLCSVTNTRGYKISGNFKYDMIMNQIVQSNPPPQKKEHSIDL